MLIRILSENPGHTFTRNIDAKFVSTVKDLLRESRDMSAQHMLRETLDLFEAQNSWDEDLAGLLAMWKKEKARAAKYGGGQTQSVSSTTMLHKFKYSNDSSDPRRVTTLNSHMVIILLARDNSHHQMSWLRACLKPGRLPICSSSWLRARPRLRLKITS